MVVMKHGYDIEAIRRAMLSKGWNQATLAARAKVPAQTLSDALGRRKRLSPSLAAKVAKALSLDLASLVIELDSNESAKAPTQEGAAA